MEIFFRKNGNPIPVPADKRVSGKNFTKEQKTYLKGIFNVFLQLLALNIEPFVREEIKLLKLPCVMKLMEPLK